MLVVLIIAILIGIGVPAFLGYRKNTNDRSVQSSIMNAAKLQGGMGADSAGFGPDVAKLALADNEKLQAGLYAKIGVPAQADQVRLSIPASALVVRGQLTSVYVVEDQVLKYRLVRTGPVAAGQVEILSGLLPGEEIVVNGLDMARHGARLEPLR